MKKIKYVFLSIMTIVMLTVFTYSLPEQKAIADIAVWDGTTATAFAGGGW